MKDFFAALLCAAVGAGIPLFALYGAFRSPSGLSAWGWLGVSVISLSAMGAAVVIWVIFQGTKKD
jgi:hypothetical protein